MKDEEYKIVCNQIQTPDGTVLISYDRHDYKTHTDTVSDEVYMVDGGTDYLRRNVCKTPHKELTIYANAPFPIIRQHLYWGTYGIKGDQPLTYVALKDMNIGHIKAILETQQHIPQWRRDYFEEELEHRSHLK